MMVLLKKSVQAHVLHVISQCSNIWKSKNFILLCMQCLNLNLCSQMRCFHSVARFCVELESCRLITSQGGWGQVVSGTGAEVRREHANARGPVLRGTVQS